MKTMLKYRMQQRHRRTRGGLSPDFSPSAQAGVLCAGLALVLLAPAIRADVVPAPEIRELIQEDQDVKIRVAIFWAGHEDVTIGPIVRTGDAEEHTVVDKATLSAAEIDEGKPVCRPTFYYFEEVDCDGDGEAECPGDCDGRLYDFWDPCVPPGLTEYRLDQSIPWASWETSSLSIEVADSQIPCDADEDTEDDRESVEDNDSDSGGEFIADNDSDSHSADESVADDDSDTEHAGDTALNGASEDGCSAVPSSATPNFFNVILQLL